jgi:hypothetical protein
MNTIRARFRRAERNALVMPARCRSRSGFVDRVVITDISRFGCRIESFALTMREGDPVVITPEVLEGLCATVCWVSGHSAGLEFATPLYGPVVEHLCRLYETFLPPRAILAGHGMRLAA